MPSHRSSCRLLAAAAAPAPALSLTSHPSRATAGFLSALPFHATTTDSPGVGRSAGALCAQKACTTATTHPAGTEPASRPNLWDRGLRHRYSSLRGRSLATSLHDASAPLKRGHCTIEEGCDDPSVDHTRIALVHLGTIEFARDRPILLQLEVEFQAGRMRGTTHEAIGMFLMGDLAEAGGGWAG